MCGVLALIQARKVVNVTTSFLQLAGLLTAAPILQTRTPHFVASFVVAI